MMWKRMTGFHYINADTKTQAWQLLMACSLYCEWLKGEHVIVDKQFTNHLYSLSNRRWVERVPTMKHGWFSLRQCPYKNSFLAVINTLITCHHSGQKREYSTADYELSNHINSFSNRQWAERRPSLNCLGDTKPISSVWSKKADAPYEHATCASLCWQLVAIGGNGGTSGSETPTINPYDANKILWYEIGQYASGHHATCSSSVLGYSGGCREGGSCWSNSN